MAKCTVNTIYDSIEACPGKTVLSGLRRRIYYQSKSNIVTMPKLPSLEGEDKPADMAALATLVGDFKLKAEEYWHYIDLKDNASNVSYETAGEEGSQIIQNTVKAIVAGSGKDITGFAREVKNDDMVYVYQEREGDFRVIGNDMFTTNTKPSGDTGAEATAAKTTTFEITCYDSCPAPYYEGKLVLSETEQLDCATGEITADAAPAGGGTAGT
ncbi:MAG: hypothetical protein LKE54_03625 [Prevotella sp.]|jgi:hypothetical protein|nr:hypothetical protein [Prevotella sp.]MCH3994136.1 hypothetical protein [Prevotella sp.]